MRIFSNMTTDIYSNSFDFKSNGGSRVYEYDGNGSLSSDPYKGFAFEYDLLGNLKQTESNYTTSYVYSSTGERLSVKSKFNGCIAKPCFYALDHLGSVRLVVSADGQVMERSDYYPSGCMITGNIINEGNIQPYKYNGKELDPMHGLYTYDYGARQYDPATILWNRMDPLCEKYYNVSPYVYCHNNPVNMTDPDGMDDYQLSRDGCFILLKKTDDNYNVIYSTTSNGNIDYKTSVNIEKGIIEEKIQRNILGQTSSNMSGNKTFNYTVDFYNFSDNESAISVFEFAAKNTDVEWSRTTIKSNNTTNTIVATSHFDGGEVGMVYLLNDIKGNNTLTPCNGEIIENSHNHRLYNYTVSIGDKKNAESIDKMFPNAKISIYTIDRYVPYNKNSEAGLLEEQVVKYKR